VEVHKVARKNRSPNYPALNLEDAANGIRRVFEKEGNRRTSGEDVAKALGHQSLSGAARVKVSALRKYGLLEPDGDGLRVSDQALSLINLPPDDPEHLAALREAALRPTLFREIHETYGDTPPSDGVLRNYLLKNEFNHKVADDVIRLYRETMDLISEVGGFLQEDDARVAEEAVRAVEDEKRQTTDSKAFSSQHATSPERRTTPDLQQRYRISPDCEVSLSFEGAVTREAIETLEGYLGFLKQTLPTVSVSRGGSASGNDDSFAPREDARSLFESDPGEEVGSLAE
jgi:hypothetical protein